MEAAVSSDEQPTSLPVLCRVHDLTTRTPGRPRPSDFSRGTARPAHAVYRPVALRTRPMTRGSIRIEYHCATRRRGDSAILDQPQARVGNLHLRG